MFRYPVRKSPRSKAICRPSGDHAGSKQPMEYGSERSPPQPGTLISCSCVPSGCTDQMEARWSMSVLTWKLIRQERRAKLWMGRTEMRQVDPVPDGCEDEASDAWCE